MIFKESNAGLAEIFLDLLGRSNTPMQPEEGAMYTAFFGLSGSNKVVPLDGRENG